MTKSKNPASAANPDVVTPSIVRDDGAVGLTFPRAPVAAVHPAKAPLVKRPIKLAVRRKADADAQPDDATGPELIHHGQQPGGPVDTAGAMGPSRIALAMGQSEAAVGQGTSDDASPAAAGRHGGSHILPYALGGLAVLGGGLALAGKGSGTAVTPPKVPASVDTPSLALAADTGSSATDGVTNRGTIAVSSLQSGAKWDYSTDNGATWTAGSGSSFILAQGTYAAGTVQVRQTDAAGTVSAAGKLAGAVTVDTAIVSPTLDQVTGDNVLTIAEARAAEGVIVSGSGEPGATIELKWFVQDKVLVPIGTTTVNPEGRWTYSFKGTAIPDATLPLTTQIKISATDAAGNISDITAQTVLTDPGIAVSGTITAGAVTSSNDLTVSLHTGDGKLVASGIKVSADGRFNVANLPVIKGAVLVASVVNGPAADYADEATGLNRNLSAKLLSAVAVGDPAVKLNINPLTTLAAQALGLGTDDKGALTGTTTANATSAANEAVTRAFGLGVDSLTGLTPAVIPAEGYPAGATLTPAQQAGVLLAAFSGLDSVNGGNAQQSLAVLAGALTVTGSAGSLGDAGLAALIAGAQVASNRLGLALIGQVAGQIATATGGNSAALTIAPVTGDDVITRSEASALMLTGQVAAGASAVALQFSGASHLAAIEGTSWSYALSADDLAALGGDGALVIRASATLADGTTVNSARAALLVQAPPQAPSFDPVLGDDFVGSAERAAGVLVSGRAPAGATVAVAWNGGPARQVLADDTGAWRTTFATSEIPANGGTSQLSAQAIDRYGNVSAPAPRAVTIDLTAPDKPGIDAVAGFDLVSPVLASAGVPVSGTAEPGAKVLVGWNGGTPREVTADAKGIWTVTFAATELPADGAQSLTAYQIDLAGNRSPSTVHPVLVLQQVAGVAIAPVAGGDGISQADAENGVTVIGVAPAGSILLLAWQGADLRTAVADANGIWKLVYQLSEIPVDGTRALTVSGKSGDGTVLSPVSRDLVIDTTPPVAPTIDPIAVDNVVNNAERAAKVTISGRGEAGTTVRVSWGETVHTATVAEAGNWSVLFEPSEVPADADRSAVSAKLIDGLKNESLTTQSLVAIRTVLPAAPVLALKADTGADTTDGKTQNGLVQVTGLVAGARWEYSADGGESWIVGRDSSFSLADDSYAVGRVRARQTDPSGNPSPEGRIAVPVLVQSEPPILTLGPVTEDGVVNAVEKLNGVRIEGSIENPVAGVAVQVTVRWTGSGTTQSKAATLDTDSHWYADFQPGEIPADGRSSVVIEARDAVGNVAALPARTVVINTVIPPAPTIGLNADTGANATDGVTKDARLSITAVQNRQQWEYSLDSGKTWEFGGSGNGSLLLGDGTYLAEQIQVRQVDSAGNRGTPAVYSAPLVVDTATPSPTIDPIGADGVINVSAKQAGVTITGTAEVGAVVTLTWHGKAYTTTAVAVSDSSVGRWSILFPTAEIPADATWPITVSAVDLAGNRSELPDTTTSVTVDTRIPPTPTIATIAGDGVISAAERQAGVTITGHTDPGTTVKVSFGGLVKNAVVADNGDWTATYLAGDVPADGKQIAVNAFATNAIANSSLVTATTVEIDTTTPNPTIAAINGNDFVNAAQKGAGLTVTGTAEADAIVVLTLGQSIITVTADAKGQWSGRFAAWQVPADGQAILIARSTDSKGNVSETVQRGLTIDTLAPVAPVLGAIASDNVITVAEAATAITVSGTTTQGTRLALRWDGQDQTVTQREDGTWSAQIAVTPGSAGRDVSAVVVSTDPAGNVGPAVSRTVRLMGSSDSGPVVGPVTSDDRINAAEKAGGVRISGLGAPNSLIELGWQGRAAEQAQVGANGIWTTSFAEADLPSDGTYLLTASAGGVTSTRSVLIDTVAPDAPSVSNICAASATGASSDLTLTAAEKGSGTIRISGSAERDASLQVNWAGITRTVQADSSGQWHADYRPGEVPGDGQTEISVTATDAAGNASAIAKATITVVTAQSGTEDGETLTGLGNGDVLSGLGGNDVLIVPDLSFAKIDGGAGADTLKFGPDLRGATLDLAHLGAGQQLLSVETIDLSGGGANHLIVDQAAILGDTGGANRLIVTGDADERVTAFGFTKGGTASDSTHTYTVYTSGAATLWVDQTIQHIVL